MKRGRRASYIPLSSSRYKSYLSDNRSMFDSSDTTRRGRCRGNTWSFYVGINIRDRCGAFGIIFGYCLIVFSRCVGLVFVVFPAAGKGCKREDGENCGNKSSDLHKIPPFILDIQRSELSRLRHEYALVLLILIYFFIAVRASNRYLRRLIFV